MTLYAYGEKLGSMADAQGDDNGPGEYTYPTDSAFKPGTFDMTRFSAFADDKTYEFVTDMAADVTNPWYGHGISTQQLNIYLRDGSATDNAVQPLRAGTNSYVHGVWKYVIVADGRFNPGVYTPEGKKIADVSIRTNGKRIIVSIARDALNGMNLKTAQYQVSMYSSVESDAGIDNIRPIFSTSCVEGQTQACDLGWLKYYRFGGAKGQYLHDNPYSTDSTASNALDIFVRDEKVNGTQAQIMSLDKNRIIVPYVKLS